MYVEGTYFGDLEVLIRQYREMGRDSSAVVDSECVMMVIGMKDLRSLLRSFRDVEFEMKRIAKKRGENHQHMINEARKKVYDKLHIAKKAATLHSNVKDVYREWKKNQATNVNKVNVLEAAKRNIK
jgi:hypothetical protein